MLIPLEKLTAILHAVSREDVEKMPPSKRRWVAQTLRAVADWADPPPKPESPKSGVLADLSEGKRAD